MGFISPSEMSAGRMPTVVVSPDLTPSDVAASLDSPMGWEIIRGIGYGAGR
jgi:hypothetical protein